MVRLLQVSTIVVALLVLDCIELPSNRCTSANINEHQINLEVTNYHQWVSSAQSIVALAGDDALVVFSSALSEGDAPDRSEIYLLRLEAHANVGRVCDNTWSSRVAVPQNTFERLKWAILASTPKPDGPILLVYARQLNNDLSPHEIYAELVNRSGCTSENLNPALLTSTEITASPGTPAAVGLTDDSFVVLWPMLSLPSERSLRGGLQARLVSGANAEPQLAAGPVDLDVAGRAVNKVTAARLSSDRFLVAYTFTDQNGNVNAALMVVGARLDQGPTLLMGNPAAADTILKTLSLSVAIHGDVGLVVWKERDADGFERAHGRRFRVDGMRVSADGESWWLSPDGIEVGYVSILAASSDRYILTYDARTNRYGPGDGQNLLMELLAADGKPLFSRYDCHEPPRPFQINHLVTDNDQSGLNLIQTANGGIYGVFTDWGDTEPTGNDRSGASIHAVNLTLSELDVEIDRTP